jgi:hypothetical protein
MVNNILQPILDHLDFTKTRLTGELDTQVIVKQEALFNAKAERAIYQTDPSLRVIAQMSKINQNFDVLQLNNTYPKMQAVLASLTGNDDNIVNFFSNTDESVPKDLLFKDITNMLSQATTAGASPSQVEMGTKILDNLMQSVKVFGEEANPESMKLFMKFVRDPSFAKIIDTLGYSVGSLQKAKDVFDKQYADVVYPKIATEFNAITSGVTTYRTPTGASVDIPAPSEFTKVVVRNGVISFVFEPNSGVPKDVAAIRIRQMNDKLSPLINDLIKVESHLQARTDYESVFEENLGGFLGYGEQEAEKPEE